MTTRTPGAEPTRPANVALVWIDHDHAVILCDDKADKGAVACLARDADESVSQFEARTVDEVVDEERVVVSGPAFARTSFERMFVAVTHRPDRLVDIEPTVLGHRFAGATLPG